MTAITASVLGMTLSFTAAADSAVGADTVLGNGITSTGLDPTLQPGSTSVGTFRPNGSRTPTGLRYQVPPAYPEGTRTADGWLYSLTAEVGYQGGGANEENYLFRQYRDWHNGFALDWVGFNAEQPETARYLSFVASNVGRRDQFFGLEAGRYNDFKVKGFFDAIPHALGEGSTYFRGGGGSYLSLPPTLTPGSSTLAAVDAAAKAGEPYVFRVQRNRAGIRGEWSLADSWKAYTAYTFEHRDGSRQMGGSMFFPLGLGPGVTVGGTTEIIEPIDYQTHDISAGVQWVNGLTQLNVSLNASIFRNANSALTWENPFDVGSVVGPNPYSANLRLGQMALAPGNQAYNVKAEYVRSIPEWRNAHVDATVSLGRMTQNKDLLTPSVNTGIGGNPLANWSNADWNTTAALSQQTADARIDTTLVNLQLTAMPMDLLTVRAKGRYYETRNHTAYTAFNPITGQYGYLAEGGGQGTVVPGESGIFGPTTEAVHYRSIPFDGSQQNLSIEGDYRLTPKTTLSGSYERENYLRHYRERDRTWDDKLKGSISKRDFAEGTLRASYEYDNRRGSEYISNPYEAYYTGGLPGAAPDVIPHTLAELRKFDLSDRSQQILNVRYNRPITEDIDAGVAWQSKYIDWGGQFGRVDAQTQNSVNFDVSWSPSDGTTGFAYYSYDRSRIRQANVNDSPSFSGSANYGGTVYLTDNAWTVSSKDRTDVLGLGLKQTLRRGMLLDASYMLTRSSTAVTYGYIDAGGAVLGTPGAPLPDIGNAFPNLTYRLHTLQTSLLVPASKQLSLRLVGRYERLSIQDWHYTGLQPGLLPSNTGGLLPTSFIDQGPRNYHTVVIGLFLQYKI